MQGIGLASAFRLITGIKVPGGECKNISTAVMWFPAVGLFLGCAAYALVRIFFALAGLSGQEHNTYLPLIVSALVVALWAYLTRGFHLDGLADMFDGFGGGWTKERRLEIMKDSRSGAFGVLALVCLLALKITAIAGLLAADRPLVLLMAPVIARLMLAYQSSFNKYARSGPGTGAAVICQAGPEVFAGALLLTVVIFWAVLPGSLLITAGLLLLVGWLSAQLVGHVSRQKIGGVTGDILGATCEIAETAVLLMGVFLP